METIPVSRPDCDGPPIRPISDRRGGILLIDARKMGRMVDRTHRELTGEQIARIAAVYHARRSRAVSPGASRHPVSVGEGRGEGNPEVAVYADIPGFCKSPTLEEIREHGHVLITGLDAGAEVQEDDGEPFVKKMQRLVAQLRDQQTEAARLDAAIAANLKELGNGT